MEFRITLPDYNPSNGLLNVWERGFTISVCVFDDSVVISANKAGLVSLANHMLTLAQDEVPLGCHFHLDSYNSLEVGSTELILEKVYED